MTKLYSTATFNLKIVLQVRHLVRVETDIGRLQRLAAEDEARAPLPTLTLNHSQLPISRQ